MNEANLAIARKVVLCAGLLTSATLFAYPHWRVSVDFGNEIPTINRDLGRAFIMSPPSLIFRSDQFVLIDYKNPARIHHIRQFTEVALVLLLTFGLMRALKKLAGVRKHNAEE